MYKKISPSNSSFPQLNLKKVWDYRLLLYSFAIRDIKVQYTQTKLGILWSFIQAITAATIVYFFFGVFFNIPIKGVPYIMFAFPGMISWYYFSYIVSYSGTSLLQAQHLIKKVYFPKLILPFYRSLVGLFDVAIWLIVFFAMAVYYSFPISWNLLLLPFAFFLNAIVGLSIALWLSAMTIRFRDAFLIIPFIVGFGIFATPVFFETAMIPPDKHFLLFFNPMAGIIAMYRWCLLDIYFPLQYIYGLIPTFILFLGGLFYFRKTESVMSDLI